MGTQDPRKTTNGVIDYRIQSQLRSFEKTDPAPVRVKPVPITLVIHALLFAYRTNPTSERKAIANMICVAFFFCLRPGEYTGTTTDDQAFALNDVALFIGTRRLHNEHSSDPELLAATSLQLTFTTQKNNDRGVIIAHARSNDVLCCPVSAATRQILLHRAHFRTLNVPFDGTMKLASYYSSQHVNIPVKASVITKTLRVHAAALESVTGIAPKNLSARSLRAGGAMALLQGGCDPNVIKLLARWKSDTMMRYLHQQSLPVFQNLAAKMYNNGTYTFLPDEWVPADPAGDPDV